MLNGEVGKEEFIIAYAHTELSFRLAISVCEMMFSFGKQQRAVHF